MVCTSSVTVTIFLFHSLFYVTYFDAQRVAACVMPPATQARIDKRVGKLAGTPDWIRAATMPFQRSGSSKAIDWKQLLQFGAEYCFADDVPRQCSEAFWDMITVIRDILAATCDVDDDEVGMAAPSQQEMHLRQLKRRAVLALAKMEKETPSTEHAIIMHIIMHLPAAIHRWNNTRNTWTFHSERYI